MAHAGSRLTAESRVRSQASQYGVYGGRSCTGTGFPPSTSVFFCQYYSSSAPYSLILHRCVFKPRFTRSQYVASGHVCKLRFCYKNQTGCTVAQLGRCQSLSGLRPLASRDCGFESRLGHGCLCCVYCTVRIKGTVRTIRTKNQQR